MRVPGVPIARRIGMRIASAASQSCSGASASDAGAAAGGGGW